MPLHDEQKAGPDNAGADASAVRPVAHLHPISPGLRLVAIFKLFQGLFLASLGTGLLIAFTGPHAGRAFHRLAALQMDVSNPIVGHLFHGLDTMSPLKFRYMGLSAFIYSVVLMVEGGALLRRKTWAEFLTIGVTASFIPLEAYEVIARFHVTTLLVMAMNIAVVVYLAFDLKRRQIRHRDHPEHDHDDD